MVKQLPVSVGYHKKKKQLRVRIWGGGLSSWENGTNVFLLEGVPRVTPAHIPRMRLRWRTGATMAEMPH